MSESPFPFEPNDESAGDDEPGSRKPLLALLGLSVVGAVAGAFLFLGGGADAPPETATAPVVKRSAAPAAEAPESPLAAPPVSATPIGLNPFKALVVEAAANGTGAVGAATGGAGSSGDGSNGTAAIPAPPAKASAKPSPAPAASVSPPAPRPAPAVAAAPVVSTVELVTISERPGALPLGTFSYDGTRYDGQKGQILAKKLEVIDIARLADGTWVATVRVGEGSPFKVYENQEVVVQ